MKHQSSLHRRFEEAKLKAQAATIAHSETATSEPPAAMPPSVVTEDLDANVLATGPRSVVMIEPNPDNAAAAVAAYDELESKLSHRMSKEMDAAVESLTTLRDQIAEANAAGGFSAESAFFAAIAIEAHSDRLGFTDSALTASFESAMVSPDARTVISTEALDFALEGVDKLGKELGRRFMAQWYRMVVPLWTMVKFAGRDLDGYIARAKQITTGRETLISVKKAFVMEGTAPSTNVGASFAKAAEILKFLVTDFSRQSKMDFTENVKAVSAFNSNIFNGKLIQKNDVFAAKSIELLPALWSQWKDPRMKLGGNPSDPIIGNYVFFNDQSLKYKGDNATSKKFDIFANHAYPAIVGYQHSGVDASGSIEIKALSPKEIVAIASVLKQTANNFGAFRSMIERLAASPVGNNPFSLYIKMLRRDMGADAAFYASLWTTPELKPVEDALKTSNRLIFHVGYDAGRVLVKTISHFKKIAKLSMRVHAKSSLESWDQATASDGISVNETAPNEPTQSPAARNQAPIGEVLPPQSTFQDQPAAKQDLNGTIESGNSPVEDLSQSSVKADKKADGVVVAAVQPATAKTAQEVTQATLRGSAPEGVTLPAAATADEHADGTPVPAVQAAGQDTDATVKEAALRAQAADGVTLPAAADADKHADGKPVAAVKGAVPDVEPVVVEASLQASLPVGMSAKTQPPAVKADEQSDQPGKVVPGVQPPKFHTTTESHKERPPIRVPYWFKG